MGLSRGSRRGVDHRSGYRFGALEARWRKLAGGVEDRIGDGANMRMDALQITQYVEVERAGVDALDAPLAQARQMVLRDAERSASRIATFSSRSRRAILTS